ncbi:ankyrin repeat protein (macronuclear) [Tetrahymena thermophila SB210]|uniref:Ankyrin repeat protein n=1 Tax=Tetrahymena thermophila (strain SB210) TaxID=312017 RepID=I7MFL4_TETTS|nr:ankyrin repeat protein [Tetrahymena thermophila SB210]EAS00308.2 ankyrin repeat protein [Tetrahymena thermophila SB210]|eukprot:XP_001020553.2 ankyrin repeat protein [Tetrahymena thermophila SB210]
MKNSQEVKKPEHSQLQQTSYQASSQSQVSQIGSFGVNGNFNSINIKKLVQQSNNYWHAERNFFNSDKNRNGIDELERMANSIENILTPKGNFKQQELNKYAYESDQNILNTSNFLHRDSFCADMHEWPDQSIDERENVMQNYEKRNIYTHNIGVGQKKKSEENFDNITGIISNTAQRSLTNQANKTNEGNHRRIQSVQSDIKTTQIQNNLGTKHNLPHGQHLGQGQNSLSNISLNGTTNLNSQSSGNINAIMSNHKNNQMKNTMMVNMNVNRNYINNANNNQNNMNSNNIPNQASNQNYCSNQTGFSQKKLQDITFSFNYVKKGASSISKNIFSFNTSTLQIVDLSFNKFRDIPAEILDFPNLRVLKLDTNLIKVLNPDLFLKVKLEYFSISNNLLFEIPQLITQWSETLKYLDVSLNRIEELSVLPSLKRLQSLHIHNNDFRFIPCMISNFENSLLELSLDWFQYTNPPLQLRQSGLHGAKIIQKLMHFLKMYSKQDNSIQYIIQKYRYSSQKQDCADVNFIEVVAYLSNQNIPFDINFRDPKDSNKCLSHKAAEREEIGCLISILEKEYNLINAIDNDNHTPLSLSILHEKFFSAKTLISNGANVNLGGSQYGTCLNLATIKYQYYLVQDLLKRGANPNGADNEGNTPLHYIMTIFHRDKSYSSKICDLLLQFRADPNIKNKDGWAPIHLVARRGQSDAFEYIQTYNKYLTENNYQNKRLPEFANLPGVKDGSLMNQQKTLNTIIQLKDSQNVSGCLQYMPFHINLKGGKDKQSPLHIACMHSCYDIVKELLESGADIFSRNLNNKTPLHLCMKDNYLYKLLKMKESEIFYQFYSLHRQIQITSPTLYTQETPIKNNILNRTNTQQSYNLQSSKRQLFQENQPIQSNNNTNQPILNSQQKAGTNHSNMSLSSFNAQQQGQQQNINKNNFSNQALQVANIIQNNLGQLVNQNNQVMPGNDQKNSQSNSDFIRPNSLSQNSKQQSKNQLSNNINFDDCDVEISDRDDDEKRDPRTDQLSIKKNKKMEDNEENEYDVSESQLTNRAANFQNLQGLNVKENSKNYNYIQNFEQKFKDSQQSDLNRIQKGQLIRNSPLLSKQKFKSGEEQNECLRADEFEGEYDDACVDHEDDSINKQLNDHLPSNPNYFQQNQIQQSSLSYATNQKQLNQNYQIDFHQQEINSLFNQKLNYLNEECDEELNKEEEFFNADIDESKSMLELISTKKKIMNQSLPYAPNNIQQLNYIQTVNRTNIQKIQASKANHSRSKSNIEGNFLSKISENQQKAAYSNSQVQKQHFKNQTKDDLVFQKQNPQKGLIKEDGLDAPPQIITPQHISFFNYLLEKTKNMHEYYSVSLQNYKKGILSEFNTLYEKFRYFVIMMKLQVEYQNMILHLNNEKEMLQSILGENSILSLGAIDRSNSNLMIMKMLLEIAENLKCESHSLLLVQKDYPTPTEQNFFGSVININNNITYWMRQYEETIHDTITQTQSNFQEDQNDVIELVQNKKREEKQNDNGQNQKDLQEDIKLYERENSILKENIIYQLGNYDFNEAINYLEKEIKSEDTSIINAFEACQSFFQIRESLYQKQSDLNNNKQRKNQISNIQPQPKTYQDDSKALFTFPSNLISSKQYKVSKQLNSNSVSQLSSLQELNGSKNQIKQQNTEASGKNQLINIISGKNSQNTSIIFGSDQQDTLNSQKSNISQQHEKSGLNQGFQYQTQFNNNFLNKYQTNLQQINNNSNLQKQQQLEHAQNKKNDSSQTNLNGVTDIILSNPDIHATKPLVSQQNQKFMKHNENHQFYSLAQKQQVLAEKALNKQLSTHSTGQSQIRDKIFSNDHFSIFEKKQSLNTNNNQLKKDNPKTNTINNTQASEDDSNNNSFNLIAPIGAKLDSINNLYIEPQQQEVKQQNKIFQFQQIKQQQQQQQYTLIPISQLKTAQNKK